MTPELAEVRHGRITASQFYRIITGGPRAWATYAAELRQARSEPFDAESFNGAGCSAATKWGNEYESTAADRYAFATGYHVTRPAPFQTHPDFDDIGCSPDGLVRVDAATLAGLEIKVPYNAANHVTHRVYGMPDQHAPQVQGSLWITGLDRWDFVSFDPRAMDAEQNPVGSLYYQEITRDEPYIQRLESKILQFRELLQTGETPEDWDPTAGETPRFF